ncbi:MAG TPA: FAD-binding oxidoreductase [Bacillota bacterium]|nr:FAD-binding oxidoreductase [Bacillota bacterium]
MPIKLVGLIGERGEDSMVVQEVRRETPQISSIMIRGELTAAFQERRAGQFLTLQVPADTGWSNPHPFTISNAPEDDYLQITVKNVGPVSSTLQQLEAGTEVRCRGPFGNFCRDIDRKKEILMIAGGIGITPFLSVLRHFARTMHRGKLTVIWANNELQDIFGEAELSGFKKLLDLRVVHVIANGFANTPTLSSYGFLEEGLITGNLLQKYMDSKNTVCFLCGSPAMQGYVLTQLQEVGVDSKNVETESFYKDIRK